MCTRWAARIERILARRRIGLVPLKTPWVRRRLGLREGEEADRIWLLLPGGKDVGGADAIIEIGRRVGWARPLAMIAGLPGLRHLLRRGYGFVARRRHCMSGACELPAAPREPARRSRAARVIDVLPLVALPALAMALTSQLAPFIFMWSLAIAIFAGCKWLTWRHACAKVPAVSAARSFAYLFAWPGLDAVRFLDESRDVPEPAARQWLWAGGKTLLGFALIWKLTPLLLPHAPLFAGWSFMVGLIFSLHFGLFHLLSLLWRTAGIDAPPMMQNPVAATSLADFWGRRWNRDFNVLSHTFVVRPLHRTLGLGAAMLLVFVLSGLVHDLVISLPAGAGFGLPMAYFLLQAAGLSFERSRFGKTIGLGQGVRGWLFTFAITALPAFALFHPWFVHRVMLPFARAIGAG